MKTIWILFLFFLHQHVYGQFVRIVPGSDYYYIEKSVIKDRRIASIQVEFPIKMKSSKKAHFRCKQVFTRSGEPDYFIINTNTASLYETDTLSNKKTCDCKRWYRDTCICNEYGQILYIRYGLKRSWTQYKDQDIIKDKAINDYGTKGLIECQLTTIKQDSLNHVVISTTYSGTLAYEAVFPIRYYDYYHSDYEPPDSIFFTLPEIKSIKCYKDSIVTTETDSSGTRIDKEILKYKDGLVYKIIATGKKGVNSTITYEFYKPEQD